MSQGKLEMSTFAWVRRMKAAGVTNAELAMLKCEVKDREGIVVVIQDLMRSAHEKWQHSPEDFWQVMGDSLTMALLLGGFLEREGLL